MMLMMMVVMDLSLDFFWLKQGYVMDNMGPRYSTNVNVSLLS